MSAKTLKLIADHEVRWVDLRFTDTKGKQHHLTFPASEVDDSFFQGRMFDGSSLAGWKGVNESDMVLLPDDSSAVLDPFADEPQVNVVCDILEPATMSGYSRDPRSIARRAEEYLKSTGIGDTAYMGPEPEFFIFDDVKYRTTMGYCMSKIISQQAAWSTDQDKEDGPKGHTPRVKGSYSPVPPLDSLHDIRTAMCSTMLDMGLKVEIHHGEVGNAGQCEIGAAFNTLVKKADEVQTLKYVIHNVAAAFGKTATFMPKPLVGDNGSGMHVHQSIFKNGKNVFAGNGYANLSEEALYYIGGIIKHAKALNAFGNPSTNSYKRLVKGFEAPTLLAYSARNRSASIRIPYNLGGNPKAVRIEARFGDCTANPYLFFAALLMAGLDGIKHKIHPGEPATKDLYDLEPEEEAQIPQVADDLLDALRHLDQDRAFLTAGGVFSDDFIDAYIDLKKAEHTLVNMTTHPLEFELYYSV
ncbi:MAG: type I glutamate--ammonia ligase [Pseudomonadales bacterium]|jgi:glutamine synthetase|nr:type I glutamate--ammonia ligase [Pseudomonadales bacterium]